MIIIINITIMMVNLKLSMTPVGTPPLLPSCLSFSHLMIIMVMMMMVTVMVVIKMRITMLTIVQSG